MKKITLVSLFGVLLVFTFSVNASATLSWGDTPDGVFASSTGSGTSTLDGSNIILTNTNNFSNDWEFFVHSAPEPGAWVSSLSITLLDDVFFDATEVFLNNVSMGFGTPIKYEDTDVTILRVFDFTEYLFEGSNILTMAANSVTAGASYTVSLTTDVKLTANPIPASVWLFGSAMLGIGGLASRRKSLPAESLDA